MDANSSQDMEVVDPVPEKVLREIKERVVLALGSTYCIVDLEDCESETEEDTGEGNDSSWINPGGCRRSSIWTITEPRYVRALAGFVGGLSEHHKLLRKE